MKKLLLLIGIAIVCAGCPMDKEYTIGLWLVKNNTEQTIEIKYPNYSIHQEHIGYRTRGIPPYENCFLFSTDITKKMKLDFDYYFEKINNLYGENVSWQVLSENDVVLKTWTYSEREQSDQRFFNETSWSLKKSSGDKIWTFEILPEDINQ